MKPSKVLCALSLSLILAACATSPDGLDYEERTAEEMYQQAQTAGRMGNYDEAVQQLEALQARFPFGAYAQQAQLDIIYMYFKAEEWDSAVAAADRFIRLNPSHERVDYAYYMKGVANVERGESFMANLFGSSRSNRDPEPLRQAFNDFKLLASQHPDSEYAEDARGQMLKLKTWLADHELTVARFYLERSAYVAAANRAKTVIENYQETPAVKPALEILVRAYDHLELSDLKQDVLRVIRLNYPDHPLVREG